MSRFKGLLTSLSVILFLYAPNALRSEPLFIQNFPEDSEGWFLEERGPDDSVPRPTDRILALSDVSVDWRSSQSGGTLYLRVPDNFREFARASYGGHIQWDQAVEFDEGAAASPEVLLKAGDTVLVNRVFNAPAADFNTFAVGMSENAGWVFLNDGRIPDEEEFKTILFNAEGLWLAGMPVAVHALHRVRAMQVHSGSCFYPVTFLNGKIVCAPLPAAPAEGDEVKPIYKWLSQLSEQEWAAARESECTCTSIQLSKVKTASYQQATGRYKATDKFDIHSKMLPPKTGDLTLPVMKVHPGKVFPPTDFPDKTCFYFSYPKSLAFLRPADKSHPCDIHVTVSFPRERFGAKLANSSQERKLYSVEGTGGTMGSGLLAAGTDGRSIISNFVCIRPITRGNEIGPSGAKGYVEWFLRRAGSLKGGADQKKCGRIPFTIR